MGVWEYGSMGVWELKTHKLIIKLVKQHSSICLSLSILNESFHSHTPILVKVVPTLT
jgi:hypothetical protein